jgi:hypothetical protein
MAASVCRVRLPSLFTKEYPTMDVLQNFKRDDSSSEDGKWFPLGPEARIKMRSFSSSASKAYRRKALVPYQAFVNSNRPLPDGTDEELIKDQMVDVIILDWEGLQANGKDLPYSKANARMLVNDAEDFVDLLANILLSADSFKAEAVEDEVKN